MVFRTKNDLGELSALIIVRMRRFLGLVVLAAIIAALTPQSVSAGAPGGYVFDDEFSSRGGALYIALYVSDGADGYSERAVGGPGEEEVSRILDKGVRLVEGLGGYVVHRYELIPGFSFRGSYEVVEALRIMGFAVYRSKPYFLETLYGISPSMPGEGYEQPSLRYSVPSIGADVLHSEGYTGEGVDVAIIDTGIQNDHPWLMRDGVSVVVAEFDATRTGVNDYCGKGTFYVYIGGFHGTAVASVIASQDPDFRGVAPGVDIYDVIVISEANDCVFATDADIIAGIDWAVKGPDGVPGNDDDADIINISLGSLTYPWIAETLQEGVRTDPLLEAIKAAVERGVIFTISAGNRGGGFHTVNVLCSIPGVICMGASDDNDTQFYIDDVVASFSSRGPLGFSSLAPHLVAPGVYVQVAVPTETGFVSYPLSGTSFSAPHAAGAAALLIDARGWDKARVSAALLQSGVSIKGYISSTLYSDPTLVHPMEQGGGLLRVDRAYRAEVVFRDPATGEGYLEIFVERGDIVSYTLEVVNVSRSMVTVNINREVSLIDVYTADSRGSPRVEVVDYNVEILPGLTSEAGLTIDASTASPGIYSGYIEAYSPGATYRIPVIIVVSERLDVSGGIISAEMPLAVPSLNPGWTAVSFSVVEGLEDPLSVVLSLRSEALIAGTVLAPDGKVYQGGIARVESDGVYKIFATALTTGVFVEPGTGFIEVRGPAFVDLNEVLERISELEDRVASLEQNLSASIDTITFQLNELREDVQLLSQQVSELEVSLESLEEALNEANAAITALEETVMGIEGRIEGLEESISSLETGFEELVSRVGRLESQLAILSLEVDSLKSDILSLEALVEENRSSISSIEGELEALSKDIEALAEELSLLEGNIEDLRRELDSLRDAIIVELESVGESLDGLEASVTSLEFMVNALSERLGELEERKADKTELEDLASEMETIVNAISEVTRSLLAQEEALNAKFESINQRISLMESSINSMEAQVLELESSRDIILVKINDIRIEIGKLEFLASQLESLERRVSQVEAEIERLRESGPEADERAGFEGYRDLIPPLLVAIAIVLGALTVLASRYAHRTSMG